MIYKNNSQKPKTGFKTRENNNNTSICRVFFLSLIGDKTMFLLLTGHTYIPFIFIDKFINIVT